MDNEISVKELDAVISALVGIRKKLRGPRAYPYYGGNRETILALVRDFPQELLRDYVKRAERLGIPRTSAYRILGDFQAEGLIRVIHERLGVGDTVRINAVLEVVE